jgi:hypothetical protein
MCITAQSSSPSRNPCSLCVLDAGPYNDRAREGAISDAHLDPGLYKSLCADHRAEVDYEVGLEGGCDPAYEYDEDDGGPDGPPVDEDGEAFYGGDDWEDGNDLHGYMGEEGY